MFLLRILNLKINSFSVFEFLVRLIVLSMIISALIDIVMSTDMTIYIVKKNELFNIS